LEEGKADLAIIRGDLDVPKNAQPVATLRKNVAVLWVPPPAKGTGKKPRAKITNIAQLAGHRVGVVGRTQANVNLPKVILQQYAEVNTVCHAHHNVTPKGLPDSTTTAIARQLLAIRQQLTTELPPAVKLETPDTDKHAAITVHPGDAAIVDGDEKAFLHRYSD